MTVGNIGMAILVRPNFFTCPHYYSLTTCLIQNAMMWPTPYGAITQLYAGTTPEGLELSGQVRLIISFSILVLIVWPWFSTLYLGRDCPSLGLIPGMKRRERSCGSGWRSRSRRTERDCSALRIIFLAVVVYQVGLN